MAQQVAVVAVAVDPLATRFLLQMSIWCDTCQQQQQQQQYYIVRGKNFSRVIANHHHLYPSQFSSLFAAMA